MCAAPYAVYRVRFQKDAAIVRKAKKKKKNCLVPLIFLLYLLSLSYTACTDRGTHSISHCTPEGWWSQIKEALHFSNAQPILSEVCFFLHEESLLSLNKTKAKNTHTGSGAVDIAAGRYALQLFLLRTLSSLWLSPHLFFFFFFCIRVKFFIVTTPP